MTWALRVGSLTTAPEKKNAHPATLSGVFEQACVYARLRSFLASQDER
jgi:hypothetical protein